MYIKYEAFSPWPLADRESNQLDDLINKQCDL